MNSDCQKYLEDPETNASHIASCMSCRAMLEELDSPRVSGGRAITPVLPLAPWEGASHRSWPLVIGVILGVVAITTAMFAMAGLSPITGLAESIRASMPSVEVLGSILRLAPGAIQNAPTGLQILVVVSFLVVNALLFVLLRRAPKGIDA